MSVETDRLIRAIGILADTLRELIDVDDRLGNPALNELPGGGMVVSSVLEDADEVLRLVREYPEART